jgi:acetylornithine deacetylase
VADFGEAVALLREFVSVPSVNPAFEGGTGEAELADRVARYLRDLGARPELQEVLPGRPNVLARLGESGPGLLLSAHLDTVQATGMTVPPFSGEVRGGRLFGRGACDTKASLAAMLVALREAVRSGGLRCRVLFAALVDEEVGFAGSQALAASRPEVDGAVFGEPTDLRLVVAHKGVLRFYVRTTGRAAHSATPELGVNAIEGMARILPLVSAVPEPRPHHPVLGPATACVTEIHGGLGRNTVPDRCRVHVDRRLLPGEDPQAVWEAWRDWVLASEAARGFAGQVEFEPPYLAAPGMETPQDAWVVRALERAARSVVGHAARTAAPYATDAGYVSQAGVPCVVFGPGSAAEAHTASESVAVEQVEVAAAVFYELLTAPG